MNKSNKDNLRELTKEQLIYLIERLHKSQSYISEICVDESKEHISSEYALSIIRASLYQIPHLNNAENLKSYIDMKMNKMSIKEYRKKLKLD